MNFSEAKFYENYLTSDFHTNTFISRRVCLPIKTASKTVMRPMLLVQGRVLQLKIWAFWLYWVRNGQVLW